MESGKLTLVEKLNLLMSKGAFVKTITHKDEKVNLYVLDETHYAVWFDASGLIDKIERINDISLLENFL